MAMDHAAATPHAASLAPPEGQWSRGHKDPPDDEGDEGVTTAPSLSLTSLMGYAHSVVLPAMLVIGVLPSVAISLAPPPPLACALGEAHERCPMLEEAPKGAPPLGEPLQGMGEPALDPGESLGDVVPPNSLPPSCVLKPPLAVVVGT